MSPAITSSSPITVTPNVSTPRNSNDISVIDETPPTFYDRKRPRRILESDEESLTMVNEGS